MSDYAAFLAGKRIAAPPTGMARVPALSPSLVPFQRAIVEWALRRGRASVFADCGLGKGPMALAWAEAVWKWQYDRPVIILAPLAVSRQFVREGAKFGVGITACREQADVRPGINVTNYDMLHKFDPGAFAGVVLDESSLLKAYDGATRTALIKAFRETPFKLCCTATPSPNDITELANHAEFMGVMTRAEMLATFFVHDGGSTQDWRLKGHAQDAFWRWVCSWAVMVRSPSDLGFSDDGYNLPPLRMHEHAVEADHSTATERGMLFHATAVTLDEQRKARRETLTARVDACAKAVNETPGQWLVWCELNDEGDALERAIPDSVQVAGADDNDTKEARLLAFVDGTARVLVTKPTVAGFGLNLQQSHQMAFVGLSHSFEQMYQAVRRQWRFGQQSAVDCHVFISSREGRVVENVKRKEADAKRMAEEMVRHMGDIQRENVDGTARRDDAYQGGEVANGDGFTMYLGDCVDVTRTLRDESVDFTVFSPPFSSLYTYSASDRDMGNCRDINEFSEHFRFLVPELLRVTKPGRLLSFHCMNLPTSKVRDGYIGINDFRGDLIRMFRDAGWIYHSEVCIWKDPVTAMQRTKAIGLLHKQLKKDSALSRQGIPDYLVTMRKPGDNPEPVVHTAADFPVALWQRYASPVWMDINPSDTLQRESAREEADEKHIAPLQLEVIRRALKIWTNPGDLVLSPFAGIGSEGYVSLQESRRFVGIELKRSYWEQAVANLRVAVPRQGTLFDLPAPQNGMPFRTLGRDVTAVVATLDDETSRGMDEE
jgi:hypothetical protein